MGANGRNSTRLALTAQVALVGQLASALVAGGALSAQDASEMIEKIADVIGGIVHPAALAAGLRTDFFDRLPETEGAVGDCEMRSDDQCTPLQVEEQLPPRLRALAYAVNETHQLLLAFRRRANDDQQALCVVLETSLHVDPTTRNRRSVGRQVALAPARVLLRPGVLEAANGGRREPTRILAEQCPRASSKSPVEMPFR